MDEIVINDIDELESLISRAFWLEGEFEQMILWDAYMTVDEKYRNIIFGLAHDSERHKITLKKYGREKISKYFSIYSRV